MTTPFYINCTIHGSTLYHRFKKDGKTHYEVHKNYPLELFEPSPIGEHKSLYGDNLIKKEFNSFYDFNSFIYNNKGKKFYGMNNAIYQFLCKEYPYPIEHNMNDINIMFFDIENEIGATFSMAETAEYPVNAITVMTKDKLQCFTYYSEVANELDNIVVCKNEKEILKKFIQFIHENEIDVICGYNSKLYDIPYIINRIKKVMGEKYTYMLSPLYELCDKPDGLIREVTKKNDNGRVDNYYVIKGIIHLDFMELYMKYSRATVPNYKLDTITHYELKEGKIDYTPYRNLKELYLNDKTLFIKYNIQDVKLLMKMNNKLKFIDLAFAVAYFAKCEIDDIFAVTRVWDCFLYNMAHSQGKVIPPKIKHEKKPYVGGYVKDVAKGYHKFIASFDLTSEYPMIIMQNGISPETIRFPAHEDKEAIKKAMINLQSHPEIEKAKELDLAICANGSMYAKEPFGIIPSGIEFVFNKRVQYKNEMKEHKKLREKIILEMDKRGMTDYKD